MDPGRRAEWAELETLPNQPFQATAKSGPRLSGSAFGLTGSD